MRNEQNAVLASLRRAQQFLDAHSNVLNGVSASTRTELDDVVTQLSTFSISQDSGSRGSKGETAKQRALRVALRRTHMVPIAEIAKFKLRDVPEFAALLLPATNANAQRTVASAYAMAGAATLHAQIFVDSGLPATFADDLRAAADAVTESIAGRSKHQGSRSGATAGLIAQEKRGRAVLRVLNALIMAHVGNDAPLIAEWRAAKAVRKRSGATAGGQSNDATPILSAPVPVTVTPTPAPTSVTPAVPVAA